MMQDICKSKDAVYYTNMRGDILSLMPSNPNRRVLEIEAGGGDTLLAIKQSGLTGEVYGIERFELVALRLCDGCKGEKS